MSPRRRASKQSRIPRYDRKLEAALRSFAETKRLVKSAKAHHVAPARLRGYARQSRRVRKVKGKWQFLKDTRVREGVPTYSLGEFLVIRVRGFAAASKAYHYMIDVSRFLNTNNLDYLTRWDGEGIEDVDGRWHPFETRPNVLYRLNAVEHEPFEQIYRIVA